MPRGKERRGEIVSREVRSKEFEGPQAASDKRPVSTTKPGRKCQAGAALSASRSAPRSNCCPTESDRKQRKDHRAHVGPLATRARLLQAVCHDQQSHSVENEEGADEAESDAERSPKHDTSVAEMTRCDAPCSAAMLIVRRDSADSRSRADSPALRGW